MPKSLVLTICIVLTIGAGSIGYRWNKAKPILLPVFNLPDFTASWIYGKSDRSALAKLLGSPFLWIVIADNTLHVSPHFPFNLFFASEAFGWDHRVPLQTILDITPATSRRNAIVLRYRHATGDIETLELRVDKIHELHRALHVKAVPNN